MKPAIVVAGPTASGKSDLAISIAQHINGYIVNADSRQVYKDFPISTAQPIPDKVLEDGTWELGGVKHFLYGFKSITEKYNLYQYNKDIERVIKENDEQYPVITGGTGLYIDSYIYNYNLDVDHDSGLSRAHLQALTKEQLQTILGNEKLINLNESDRGNPVRLIREIEKGSNFPEKRKGKMREVVYLYLDVDPIELEHRIRQRINRMFDLGLESEAKKYFDLKKQFEIPKIIGLEEFGEYFSNEATEDDVKEKIFLHTRQYAKRQRTWFARNKDLIKVKTFEEAIEIMDLKIGRNS
ncbi:MAG TPA: tRNA (adenosine(37)-N6)-dimethylallyltransferase MiaA [Candidatus Dojkabacteria bacterium]|nr:tRNA (adenosine(37)-N6)-dimethylallyltransferase MiaA [Candidatus Dojkabacteria bacterium]